ncbi:anthranilate phosphoribosyltransferase [Robiginitomaculum antarcticum]|uniref:anthranilate phosphoribosyltransferase n=1 Tax=Robiginitomaculum antarcticum TaxID=437507 RepID=UPI0003690747|nr:anthranilate phosphoribosyltransferase [Robiginitomaculum antarcticum]
MSVFNEAFDAFVKGKHPSEEVMTQVLQAMLSGRASDAQIGAVLLGLEIVGVTTSDIEIGAGLMREHMSPVKVDVEVVDTVGTGGDGHNTFNISTTTAIVAAACGAHVAKHGSRAVSSKSGSSDVLAELGVDIDANAVTVARCITEAGVGFLFAPKHHGAMRHVAAARAGLGRRTLFNLLGPLTNPAGAKRQLVGVYDKKWCRPMAEALQSLGSKHAWVVHGHDGLDELTVTGKSHVIELKDGKIRQFTVHPEQAGLGVYTLEQLRGGSAELNAQELSDVLRGQQGAYRDCVILNTAATLIVAGLVDDLSQGAAKAAQAIDSGAALQTLTKLARMSYSG